MARFPFPPAPFSYDENEFYDLLSQSHAANVERKIEIIQRLRTFPETTFQKVLTIFRDEKRDLQAFAQEHADEHQKNCDRIANEWKQVLLHFEKENIEKERLAKLAAIQATIDQQTW